MQDASSSRPISRRPQHGLILSRDQRLVEAARAAMALEGLWCSAAPSPASAVEHLQQHECSLVLCDDAATRPCTADILATLRRSAPQARILHLLGNGSANFREDLRRQIGTAMAWSARSRLAGSSPPVNPEGVLPLLEQASPMAALLLSADQTICAANHIAQGAGCAVGSALPALTSFPLTTWSLAESQAEHQRLIEAWTASLRSSAETPTRLFAMRATRIDGQHLLMSACEIADADDDLNQAARLLTPREERLQALEKFADGVTTAFSELFTILGGCAHLLRARFPRADADPDLRSIVQPVETAVRQGSELIERLRTFCEQQEALRERVDALALMRTWSRTVRASAGGSAHIQVEVECEGGAMIGNRKLLHEALMQLTVNAIDAVRIARPTNPRIQLRLRVDRLGNGLPALAFVISDNGCGIDEASRDRIFDPFFTTKGAGSRGLGLAAVASTVRSHGGEVRVRSRPGDGSEFQLLLPRAPAEDTGTPAWSRIRLLVVDGDRLTLEVTTHALRALGCEVATASNSLSAQRVCAEGGASFDALVIDGGIGAELCARVIDHARATGVPRIVVLASVTDISTGAVPDADRVLRKPCSAWDLLESVRCLKDGQPPAGSSSPTPEQS